MRTVKTNKIHYPESEFVALYNHDAERGILGGILLENGAYYQAVAAGLRAEHFSLDSNRLIFASIHALASDAMPADIITLSSELATLSALEKVGGVAYISSLTEGWPRGENIEHYVVLVKDCWRRRQLIHVCTKTIEMAQDPGDPVSLILAGTGDELLALRGDTATQAGQLVKDFSGEVLADVERLMYVERKVLGLTTGVHDLDEATTGIRAGEMVVVAGFPGSGKTSKAVGVARANLEEGRPVGMFSLEMRKSEILLRLWSQVSGINHRKLRNPQNLMKEELATLKLCREKVDQWPFLVDDSTQLDLEEMVARARLYIGKHKLELLIVDFLQRVHSSQDTKEYDRVTRVSNVLTDLAKETKVPILALSQLTKADGKDVNQRPNIQMLRGSGVIEQNAHLVVFTYHPVDDKTNDPTGKDCLIIGKQRNGPCGNIPASYDLDRLQWRAAAGARP